jgi:hypothetical protein
LSTEEFEHRLKTVHHFPDVFAVALAENLSVYRDDPEAWVDGTDFAIQDVCLPLPYISTTDTDNQFLACAKLEDLGRVC